MTYNGGIGGELPSPSPAQVCKPLCGVPQAATGWCSVATGLPVIVLITQPCDGSEIYTQQIDAGTGEPIVPGPVMPCGEKDWEINQLCDVDETGEVVAIVVQIFEWDSNTGTLTITLEKADDPGVPYVPVGTLQECPSAAIQAISEKICAEDSEGNFRQLIAVSLITSDGGAAATYFLDAEGAVTTIDPLETLTVGSCYDVYLQQIAASTDGLEALLASISGSVTGLEACCADTNAAIADSNAILAEIDTNTDGIEPGLAEVNTNLVAIQGFVDGIETALAVLSGSVDGLEDCCAAGNILLQAIDANTDDLESLAGTGNTILDSIDTNTNALQTLVAGSNVLLTAIGTNTDGLEAALATIAGHVDGIEGLVTASNAYLAAIDANTDGLEAALTTITGHLDGLETLIGTTNSTLTTIDGRVDGLEALIGASNTLLTSIETLLTAISGKLPATLVGGRLDVNVGAQVVSTFSHGQNVDIDSGANEQVVVASTPASMGVLLKAHAANTPGIIYIGGSGVTTANGYPLSPGESVVWPINDANKIYAIGSTNNLVLSWVAM